MHTKEFLNFGLPIRVDDIKLRIHQADSCCVESRPRSVFSLDGPSLLLGSSFWFHPHGHLSQTMCLLSAILEAELGLSPLCHLTASPPPIPKPAPTTSHRPCSPLTFPTCPNLINESAFTPSTCPCPLSPALPCPYLATCTMLCFFFFSMPASLTFHHLLIHWTLDTSLHLCVLKNSLSRKPLYSHLVVNKSASCTKLWLIHPEVSLLRRNCLLVSCSLIDSTSCLCSKPRSEMRRQSVGLCGLTITEKSRG